MGSILPVFLSILSIAAAALAGVDSLRVRRRLSDCEKLLKQTKREIGRISQERRETGVGQQRLRRQITVTRDPVNLRRTKARLPVAKISPFGNSAAKIVARRLLSRGQAPEVVSQKVLLPVTEILELQSVLSPLAESSSGILAIEPVADSPAQQQPFQQQTPRQEANTVLPSLRLAEAIFVRDLALL